MASNFDFSGVEDANIYERGQYLPTDGKFRLRVVKTLVKTTRKSGPGFIAEFTVLESNHPDVPVGGKRSWFQKLQDKDVAYPALQDFIGKLLGVDYHDKEAWADFKKKLKDALNEAGAYEGPDDGHPLHGLEIMCETYTKETKAGKDFTVHDWSIA